jgi:hypothetical protein
VKRSLGETRRRYAASQHHRKQQRDGGQRFDADHLAEIDIVDGAEQRLQHVAQHHGYEEDGKRLPEGFAIGHEDIPCE